MKTLFWVHFRPILIFWPKILKRRFPQPKKNKKNSGQENFFFFAVTSCKKSDFFLQKIRPCHFISQMNFIQKIRKCLQAVQQKNLWTNGQTNGEYFIEPSLHASIKLHYLCANISFLVKIALILIVDEP